MGSASADHNVSIHNIGRPAGSKEPSDVGGIKPVKSHDVGGRLAEESGQMRLPFRLADSLSKGAGRDRDAGSGLPGPR
jgi:hypothetical protein